MKKMAIKGLVALATVVALCMFFSGTIKTISTAKVRLVTAKQGKLEEEIKLSGNLTFTQTEEVKLALASDPQSVTIKRVRVAKGRKVAAGDVLFEAEVSGYDKEMESLRSDYEAAQKELMELERKNGDVRLKRTEEIWVEAYDALAQSKDDLMNAQTQLEVAAKLAGVTLTDGRLPEKEQDETLLEAQKAVDKAQAAQDEAQKKFNSANRLGISENVISYITQSRTLNEKLTAAQEKITALDVLARQAKQVTAPHDGYIVEINVKAGDSYDGRTAAIVISAEDGDAVLRADTSKIEKKIDKGTQVTVKRDNDKTLSKKVTDSGVDEEGKRYIDVKLTDKDIGNLGRRRGAVLRRSGYDGQLPRDDVHHAAPGKRRPRQRRQPIRLCRQRGKQRPRPARAQGQKAGCEGALRGRQHGFHSG